MSGCAICLQRQVLRFAQLRSRALHTSSTLADQAADQLYSPKSKRRYEEFPAPIPTPPSNPPKRVIGVPRVNRFSPGARKSIPLKQKHVPREETTRRSNVAQIANQASATTSSTTPTVGVLGAVDADLEIERALDDGPLPDFDVWEDWASAHADVASSSRGSIESAASMARQRMVQKQYDRFNLKTVRVDDSEDLRVFDISKAQAEDQDLTAKPRRTQVRPDRRTEVSDLPPLVADDYHFDAEKRIAGMMRYNWKTRALSRGPKEPGKRWYPSLDSRRIISPLKKLSEGDRFHEQYEEYSNHFINLLRVEHDEDRRIFFERLKKWSPEMLKTDGQALFGLSASMASKQSEGRWTDVEFKLMKNGKAAQLPYNRFETPRDVILSRRDPLVDPATRQGSTKPPQRLGGDISGQVTAAYKDCIVVRFDASIQDVEMGKWRLDLGLSDYVYAVQKRAIRNLNLDVVNDDASTFANDAEDDTYGPREEPVLAGTALRHILFRAFQEKFKPYHSVAGILPVASREAVQAVEQEEAAPEADNVGSSPQQSFLGSQSLSMGASGLNTALETVSSIRIDVTRTPNPVPEVNEVPLTDDVIPPTSDLKPTDIDAQTVPEISQLDVSHMLYMNQHIHSWALRHMVEGDPVRCEGDPDIPLNPSQIRAIAMMLYNRLSLVQGPPGTGKTRVIIETIKLLKQHWQIPHPILVTAHTNVAVDNLLAGLVGKGKAAGHGVKPIKALRVGPTVRVPERLMSYTYEAVESQHPLYRDIDHLGAEIEKLYFLSPTGKRVLKDPSTRSLVSELRSKRYWLTADMRQDILADHDVICTTCIGAASPVILKHIDFPFVFLDEASMATEPLSLVPLMKGSSQVAILGDHKQLPPVIKSEDARFGGLDTSLFERLIHERHNVPRVMLDTQYRMHPAIAAFPSRTFYNGDLRDGTIDATGTAWSHLAPPESTYLRDVDGDLRNVMFINHEHEQSVDHESLANFQDADIAVQVVMDLLKRNPNLQGNDIGIIAPYAAQIRLLQSQFRSDIKSLTRISKTIGSDRAREVGDIEIKTVDGFEGREKEVIVFSTVRSNPGGWIGFLADWRRLNVGITRAKRALIIIGDARTLENARIGVKAEDHLPSGGTDVWREFIEHLRAQGQILDYRAIEGTRLDQ